MATSSQNQMMKRKNSNIQSRTSPLPNVAEIPMAVSFVVT